MEKLHVNIPVSDIPEMNHVEVSIVYDKGGYGGLDWTYSPRGYYLHITPCFLYDNGSRRTIVDVGGNAYHKSGFKKLLMETKRANTKTMTALFAAILPIAEELARLHEAKQYQQAVDLSVVAVSHITGSCMVIA